MRWPDGKKAAFTIIDDTDDAEMPRIAEIYDLLIAAGLRTTKTVWVYPVRDTEFFRGDCLSENEDYLSFIKNLIARGFEIGLHNVGSGDFTRPEILAGLELYKQLLGDYPHLHVNHSYNRDNIYGGDKRFSFPFDLIVRLLHGGYGGFEGEIPTSAHYWGDLHKKHIKFSRSYEVAGLNLAALVRFPYTDAKYSGCCNKFFPSVFCSNQDLFSTAVTEASVKQLIAEGGCSIVYTHLGYYHERGGIDPGFVRALDVLKQHAGELWFAPVGEILEHMEREQGLHEIGRLEKLALEARSLWTRLKYRYITGLDDYHYKKSVGAQHRFAK